MDIIRKIEQEQLKSDIAEFHVGDTVDVHARVVEGGKERIQIFSGVVIAKRGSSVNQSFTVRKISYGEGVERSFPVHTPRIAKSPYVSTSVHWRPTRQSLFAGARHTLRIANSPLSRHCRLPQASLFTNRIQFSR